MQYSIIDNKTVRKNEKFYKKFKKINKELPTLVKTNRGYFLDGHHTDLRSVKSWFIANGDKQYAKATEIFEPKINTPE